MPLDRQFTQRLAQRLARRLPGVAGQTALAPQLSYGRHRGPPPHDVKQAAVLVLLFRQAEQWRLPLTVRPPHMTTHGGQVSFPGGEVDRAETPEQAALREYREELGEPPPGLTMLGRLSPIYVYASNYLVTPCVAAAAERPDFSPNPREVANVIAPPLVDLFDPARYARRTMRRYEVEFTAPQVEFDGHCIWGATCMMLGELQAVWEEPE